MRVAQIAPLYESVPPKSYGGTERIVSYLTEELVGQGHEVTLFASGDSVTSARLIPGCASALRLNRACSDAIAHHVRLVDIVFEHANEFDVLHFHIDYLHLPLMARQNIPYVTTLHGRLDLPDLVPLYQRFCDAPLVSISYAQRAPLHWANWQANVHHGLPEDLYSYHAKPEGYLAFLGRMSPEKRADRAIEIARRSCRRIRIAAKVDKADEAYFHQVIKPLLTDPLCEYLGEIGDDEKDDFLGNASALLFPIDWPEPFGLVLIEAMACGTPVIAYSQGSVPEVVEDGVSGILVHSIDEAVRAVETIEMVSRWECRQAFLERFSAQRMANDYLKVYESLVSEGTMAPEYRFGFTKS
jgi:glycosyltransferase involved in cell wall biosynthesis